MTHPNPHPSPHPYDALTPDLMLDAVESLGFRCDGRLQPLNSYENRVYQIGVEDAKPWVVKFYRPDRWRDAAILEEHVFAIELFTREIPVVPPHVIGTQSLFTHGGFRFALFEKRGGRAPELDRPDVLEWMGRFLGRIHAVGAIRPFQHRPTLDAGTFGDTPRNWIVENNFIPADLLEPWKAASLLALERIRACYARAGEVKNIRLHGDCHGGNVLYTDDGPHFVDFDDARMGPAIQDLWMLLSGTPAEMARQLREVIEAYEEFCEFDRRELFLIEALRTLRLIHYSAWLAQRWQDPAFPIAFPFFNTSRYWQDRILELKEQIAAMDEAPLSLTY